MQQSSFEKETFASNNFENILINKAFLAEKSNFKCGDQFLHLIIYR
jgi:hypothetical protein